MFRVLNTGRLHTIGF